jgi:hypothetical protein
LYAAVHAKSKTKLEFLPLEFFREVSDALPEQVAVMFVEDPDAVLARPLSLASYPVATGRPRPGHQRPRAREAEEKAKRGAPAAFCRGALRCGVTP